MIHSIRLCRGNDDFEAEAHKGEASGLFANPNWALLLVAEAKNGDRRAETSPLMLLIGLNDKWSHARSFLVVYSEEKSFSPP